MPTYKAQIQPKGSNTLDPDNWQEFTNGAPAVVHSFDFVRTN